MKQPDMKIKEEYTMAYDICSLPDIHNFNMTNVLELWRDHKLVLWDSSKGASPIITPDVSDLVIIDTAKQREDETN